MAICWKEHAGFRYLKSNNIAICIDDIKKIDQTLRMILKNPSCLIEYANKAIEFGKINHDHEKIKKSFMADLESFVKN